MAEFDQEALKNQKELILKKLQELIVKTNEVENTQKKFTSSYNVAKKQYDEIEKKRNEFLRLQSKQELSTQSLKNVAEFIASKKKELAFIDEKIKEIEAKKGIIEIYETLKQELLAYQTQKAKYDQKVNLQKELHLLLTQQKELEGKFDATKYEADKKQILFLEEEIVKNDEFLKKLISEIGELQAFINQIQTT